MSNPPRNLRDEEDKEDEDMETLSDIKAKLLTPTRRSGRLAEKWPKRAKPVDTTVHEISSSDDNENNMEPPTQEEESITQKRQACLERKRNKGAVEKVVPSLRSRTQPEIGEVETRKESKRAATQPIGRELSKRSKCEKKEEVRPQKNSKTYRSNLLSLISEVSKMEIRSVHINILEKYCPFYELFDVVYNEKINVNLSRKNDKVLKEILSTFDKKAEKFIIGENVLTLQGDDIRKVFGINDGQEPLVLKMGRDMKKPFYQRRFLGCGATFKKRNITTALSEALRGSEKEDIEDVARLMTLYMLDCLFVTNKLLSLAWGYVIFTEEVEKMKEYNWADHICSVLIKSIKESEELTEIKGCVTALPYWIMEVFQFSKPIEKDAKMLCTKWNIRELTKELRKMQRLEALCTYEEGTQLTIEYATKEPIKVDDDGEFVPETAQEVPGIDDLNFTPCLNFGRSNKQKVTQTTNEEQGQLDPCWEDIFIKVGDTVELNPKFSMTDIELAEANGEIENQAKEISQLKKENSELTTENQALKEENKKLKFELQKLKGEEGKTSTCDDEFFDAETSTKQRDDPIDGETSTQKRIEEADVGVENKNGEEIGVEVPTDKSNEEAEEAEIRNLGKGNKQHGNGSAVDVIYSILSEIRNEHQIEEDNEVTETEGEREEKTIEGEKKDGEKPMENEKKVVDSGIDKKVMTGTQQQTNEEFLITDIASKAYEVGVKSAKKDLQLEITEAYNKGFNEGRQWTPDLQGAQPRKSGKSESGHTGAEEFTATQYTDEDFENIHIVSQAYKQGVVMGRQLNEEEEKARQNSYNAVKLRNDRKKNKPEEYYFTPLGKKSKQEKKLLDKADVDCEVSNDDMPSFTLLTPTQHQQNEEEDAEKQCENKYTEVIQEKQVLRIRGKSTKKPVLTQIDKKVIKLLPENIIQKINRVEETAKQGIKVWSKDGKSWPYVPFEEITAILTGDKLGHCTIDSYADILMEKYKTIFNRFVILRGCIWKLMISRDEKAAQQRGKLIDKVISKFYDGSFGRIIIPLLSNGNEAEENEPDHWTLLEFQPGKNAWCFYNSLKYTHGDIDHYAKDSLDVMIAVNDVMDWINEKAGKEPIPQRAFISKTTAEVAQQAKNSNDCAIFVCYWMNCLAQQKPIPKKITERALTIFRVEMIKNFLDDFDVETGIRDDNQEMGEFLPYYDNEYESDFDPEKHLNLPFRKKNRLEN